MDGQREEAECRMWSGFTLCVKFERPGSGDVRDVEMGVY
jgi:hypothetical protein